MRNYTQRFIGKEQADKNFLHINSEHSMSLKNSIPYNQVLGVKRTCSTIEKLKLYSSELKQKFIGNGYKSDLLDTYLNTYQQLKN